MAEYNVKLIDYPDFLNSYDDNYDFINLNQDFWDYIFLSEELKKSIKIERLSKTDQRELSFIFVNLKVAYKIFMLLKYRYLGAEMIIFAFNIINSYLIILEKSFPSIIIRFYNYFVIRDKNLNNVEDNLLYKFFNSKNSFFNKLKPGDKLTISLQSTHQIYQIDIIKMILDKSGIILDFEINLGDMIWFENKLDYKRVIEEKHPALKVGDIFNTNNYKSRQILGKKYPGFTFFGNGCDWRKCSFCNIGKFHEVYKSNDIEEKIEEIIFRLKKQKNKIINISDPSIDNTCLIDLCKRIIEEKIDVKMHIMTRYSDLLTKDNLKILSEAGAIFIGIGLESASTRLNNLMQKYEKDYTEIDFQNFASNCIDAGINVHFYSIFGFPTETLEEMNMTKDLLLKNISKNNFFSFTAGKFCINRGTDVYKNPQKYGVKFLGNDSETETHLTSYYEENYKKYDRERNEAINYVYNKLFFGDIESFVDIQNFWFFIEESKIFHILKLTNFKNPFLNELKLSNKKSKNIKILKYLQFSKKELKIKNWITMSYIKMNKQSFYFLYNYDNGLSFNENINNYNFTNEEINMFFEKYILIDG